ncbi:hypothetical protein LTR53_002287 [Teratosphaeriaceae sp. CCFEE 6253]|nr:hypothetical protein LTR53_002287 [Teratosphaeriaceae sp. CCFEE 6253]
MGSASPCLDRRHAKTDICPPDKSVKSEDKWQFLFQLNHPGQAVPDPDFQEGLAQPHKSNSGRLPRRSRVAAIHPDHHAHHVEEARSDLKAGIRKLEDELKYRDLQSSQINERIERLESIIDELLGKIKEPIGKLLTVMIRKDAPSVNHAWLQSTTTVDCPAQPTGLMTPASLHKSAPVHGGFQNAPPRLESLQENHVYMGRSQPASFNDAAFPRITYGVGAADPTLPQMEFDWSQE